MTKKLKKNELVHTSIGIKITRYNAVIDNSINYEVHNLKYCRGDENVYNFSSKLEIDGVCNYPENKNEDTYSIAIYGEERRNDSFLLKLKDCHVIDDKWMPVYRKVKNGQLPVYDVPKGIGHLEKTRGTKHWSGCIWVPSRVITDMLTLLPNITPLYLDIHEIKEGKSYWIRSLSLQMNNPAES